MTIDAYPRPDWRQRARFAERKAARLHHALEYACDYDAARIREAREYGVSRERADRRQHEAGPVMVLPPVEHEQLDTMIAAERRATDQDPTTHKARP